MTTRILSVEHATAYIRELLDSDSLLQDVWLEGEVSESFVSRAGHVYFTLRGGDAKIKCVLFRTEAMRQRILPQAGSNCSVHGRITVYERDGAYQLRADVVQPVGLGLQALQLERLRQRLDAEGLFEPTRKRPIPAAPRYIGVVTSLEGAVWHDIQTILRRRYPLAHVIVAGSAVQGESAPAALTNALERLQTDGRAEVIIVARGGGSVDDLACFNDEGLARAVFACRVPVVSAVGHETDWTIIDLVADLRAPTPSAAAELCSPSIEWLRDATGQRRRALGGAVLGVIADRREETNVTNLESARRSISKQIDGCAQEIVVHRHELAAHALKHASARHRDFGARRGELNRHGTSAIVARRLSAARSSATLAAMNPAAVLGRGYAFAHRHGDAAAILSATDLAPGDRIVTVFAAGAASSVVDSIGVDRVGSA